MKDLTEINNSGMSTVSEETSDTSMCNQSVVEQVKPLTNSQSGNAIHVYGKGRTVLPTGEENITDDSFGVDMTGENYYVGDALMIKSAVGTTPLLVEHGMYNERGNKIGDTLSFKKGSEKSKVISDNFNVVGLIGDLDSGEYEYVIQFVNVIEDEIVEVVVPSNVSASKLEQVLCSNGASVYDKKALHQAFVGKRNQALKLLKERNVDVQYQEALEHHDNLGDVVDGKRIPKVIYHHSMIGWKGNKYGSLYFLGSKSIGNNKDSIYQGNFDITPTRDLGVYINMLKDYVYPNTNLLSVISMGVSATVLGFVNRVLGLSILNPLVHNYGDSTTGKTTAAMLAVSLGGKPTTSRGESTFMTFNGTANALLKKLNINQGYPVCIDEFSMASKSKEVDRMLYAIADGEERERLERSGGKLQKKAEFETVILTTGEQTILNKKGNTGLRARVFELGMIPWTTDRVSADTIKAIVSENYGFITPLVAEYLLGLDDTGRGKLKERFDYWLQKFLADAKKGLVYISITDRVCKTLALFMISLEIFFKVIDLNKGDIEIQADKSMVDAVYKFFFDKVVVFMAEEANIGIRAYNYIIEYFLRNMDKFYFHEGADKKGENCIGILYSNRKERVVKGFKCNYSLCFTPSQLEEILVKDGGFSSIEVCVKGIKDLSFLVHEKDRTLARFPFRGKKISGYRILIEGDDEWILNGGYESLELDGDADLVPWI